MTRKDYCPDGFLNGLYDTLRGEPFASVCDKASAEAAAEEVRQTLREVLALPVLENMRTNASPVPVGEPICAEDYTIQKYAHALLPGLTAAV